MKNLHLVPPSVIDIVEKLSSPTAHENEKMNYLVRLEAIRNYCIDVINNHNNSRPVVKLNMRRKP